MKILDYIDSMNKYDLINFKKFFIGNQHVGWIHLNNIKYLEEFNDVFVVSDTAINLSDELDTFEKRTLKVGEVLKVLSERGIIQKWRDELYDVAVAFGTPTLMQMERAAVDMFGIKKYGIHANAYCIKDEELHIWVAKRSMSKKSFPGKLDQLIAGGFTGGRYTPSEIFIKEAYEEAGMSKEIAKSAISTGCVSYTKEEENNLLTRGNIFIFDIETPDSFNPVPVDGEVDAFYLMSANEILEIIENEPEQFKDNCVLVAIDFLIRRGVISSNHPDYVRLAQKLHQ